MGADDPLGALFKAACSSGEKVDVFLLSDRTYI